MVNPLIIVGFVIHLLITVMLFGDPKYSMLGYVFMPFVIANVIGIILMLLKHIVVGARIFMISSFVFFPIGAIGVLGARKEIDKIKKESFINNLNK
ncbi:hypothetical protein DMA11_16780 [Marinilabiliaceae bacterium JC017]|nr:hypothetical protein DMA11_16780 [Marinilabiliaceae bacterium JC017]